MFSDPRFTLQSNRPPPSLKMWEDVELRLTRVHEFCGTARHMLALRVAARAGGAVFWIAPRHGSAALHAPGMAEWCDPRQVIFVEAKQPMDVLWSMEEILRSGVAPVVVADLPRPPEMTPVRRLHLAAEAGGNRGPARPIGLLLTPGKGGAQGIETRWCCDSVHDPQNRAWRLERLRARMMPPKQWRLMDDRLHPWSTDWTPGHNKGGRLKP